MEQCRLFHISEDPTIKKFLPRPTPSSFETIGGNVVFAITEQLLHNYLLPRDCPRVCFYARADSSENDIKKFMGAGIASYVIALESKWLPAILGTTIYCYELPTQTFSLLDECAGYYISYDPVVPISVKPITNLLTELSDRKVEVRFIQTLWQLAGMIKNSTLNFSMIRMRHAQNDPSDFPQGSFPPFIL